MSLPIVVLPTHEKWDCHQCGACCRSSLVLLNEEDIEKLKSQKWDERDPFRNSPIITRTRFPKRSYRLAQKADGSCVFLDSIGHCRIHLEFGADAKPTVCRNFPMQLVPREGKAVLTVRRSCPSAADDNGLPLKQFLSSTQKQVREGKMSCKEISPPALKSGERHHWKIVSHALNVVADLLQDPRFPPVRRLVHALQFAKLLALAKTKAMAEEKLVALLDTLAQVVPEESKQFFDERRQPGAYANILFRSIGVEYARLHPHCRAHRNWAHRASMAGTLFRLVRGSGSLPSSPDCFPSAQFNDLEKPLGRVSLDIDHSLTRFIETSAASYIYAITDRHGWSLVDSVRGLVVTFPVGLWLMRWVSHGREPTTNDMINLVVALDRGNGYAPLTGQIQRQRLRLLAMDNQLERLVVWYAR